jgi:hypothetical protein
LEVKFSFFGLWFCTRRKSKGILTTHHPPTVTMASEAHGKRTPSIWRGIDRAGQTRLQAWMQEKPMRPQYISIASLQFLQKQKKSENLAVNT